MNTPSTRCPECNWFIRKDETTGKWKHTPNHARMATVEENKELDFSMSLKTVKDFKTIDEVRTEAERWLLFIRKNKFEYKGFWWIDIYGYRRECSALELISFITHFFNLELEESERNIPSYIGLPPLFDAKTVNEEYNIWREKNKEVYPWFTDPSLKIGEYPKKVKEKI